MRKFCNITFVEEDSVGSNGERVKLLRCSRCSGVFYRGKEEQRQHWKTHKKVCLVTSPDEITRISHFTMDEAAVDLMHLLRTKNFLAGRKWTLLLQRICELFRTSNDRSDCFNEEIVSNMMIGSGMILSCARELAFASTSEMDLLWAAPNFANFMLSVKDQFISDSYIERRRRGDELTEDELSCYEFNPQIHVDPGCSNLLMLFVMAGVVSRTQSIGHVTKLHYRKTGYSEAAFRVMIDVWKDPYARASMILKRNQMTSVRQEWCPLTIMNVIDQSPLHPLYIAPGLSVHDAVKTVIDEGFIYTPLRLREMIDCILDSYAFEKEAWGNFRAEERANCALLVVEKFLKVNDRPQLNPHLTSELSMALTGWATRGQHEVGHVKDAQLRFKVIKLASQNKTPTAERIYPRRMCPADYFGLFHEKMIKEQMPLVEAFLGDRKAELPEEMLVHIAEFASDPFSEESRNSVEFEYLANFW